MKKYAIAMNLKTTRYEIHAAGCAHTKLSSKFDFCSQTAALNAQEAAAQFERKNEGCACSIGACVKKEV